MRTTMTLDDDVYAAASQLARASGKRLGQVMSELAKQGLQRGPLKIVKRGGLPVIAVPRGSPTITVAAVQRILAEE